MGHSGKSSKVGAVKQPDAKSFTTLKLLTAHLGVFYSEGHITDQKQLHVQSTHTLYNYTHTHTDIHMHVRKSTDFMQLMSYAQYVI